MTNEKRVEIFTKLAEKLTQDTAKFIEEFGDIAYPIARAVFRDPDTGERLAVLVGIEEVNEKEEDE